MLRQRRVSAVAAALLTGLLAGSAMLPALAQDATPAPAAPAAQAPAAPAPAAPAPAAPAAAAPAAPAAAATTAEPPAEQVAVAVQFLRASGLTAGFDDMIPQFMQQANAVYANQRPELAGMINQATIELVPEFMKERADLDQGLAKLYITKFSQDELKQLTAFYLTPVGQKFSKEQQTIIRDSVPVVQEWTRKLQGDIMTRIKDEVGKKGGKL